MTARCPAYLAFVREHVSCLAWFDDGEPMAHDAVEGAEPTIAHHVRMGGRGGVGLKPSDFLSVPLTDAEHRALHNDGERSFWNLRGVDPDRVMTALLTSWFAQYGGDDDDVPANPDGEPVSRLDALVARAERALLRGA